MHRLLNQYGLLLLLTGGLALIFLSMLPEGRRIARVVEQGRLVPVEVIHGSTYRLGNRAQSYLDFRYAGRNHTARVSHVFRQRVQDAPTTGLLHLPEYPIVPTPGLRPPVPIQLLTRAGGDVSGLRRLLPVHAHQEKARLRLVFVNP